MDLFTAAGWEANKAAKALAKSLEKTNATLTVAGRDWPKRQD